MDLTSKNIFGQTLQAYTMDFLRECRRLKVAAPKTVGVIQAYWADDLSVTTAVQDLADTRALNLEF